MYLGAHIGLGREGPQEVGGSIWYLHMRHKAQVSPSGTWPQCSPSHQLFCPTTHHVPYPHVSHCPSVPNVFICLASPSIVPPSCGPVSSNMVSSITHCPSISSMAHHLTVSHHHYIFSTTPFPLHPYTSHSLTCPTICLFPPHPNIFMTHHPLIPPPLQSSISYMSHCILRVPSPHHFLYVPPSLHVLPVSHPTISHHPSMFSRPQTWKDEEAALVDKVACQPQEYKEKSHQRFFFKDPKVYQQAFSIWTRQKAKMKKYRIVNAME